MCVCVCDTDYTDGIIVAISDPAEDLTIMVKSEGKLLTVNESSFDGDFR